MRMSHPLTAAVLLSVLVLTGCDDTASTTKTADTTPRSTPSATTPGPTAASSPNAAMPDLHDRTFSIAAQQLAALPGVRVTAAAQHKDVTLPKDHDSWRVCDSRPSPGTPITGDGTVVLKLAQRVGDCKISYHGYLHQTNDPAYTPPQTRPPAPKPTHTSAPATPKPTQNSLTTCPDGKQGYACTSNGHPVVDGQFCPSADHGRTLKATNGTMVTCSYDPSVKPYRWQ